MVARAKLKPAPKAAGYFDAVKPYGFCRTGCTLLDLVLGGGWARGRIANVIGDRSTGKTLLAIEAATNFAREHPKGSVRYRESEAAFDEPYAAALGMPPGRVDLSHIDTVEALYADLEDALTRAAKPCFYIVDSLDALSDVAEKKRKFEDRGTYGTDKAAALSELFRRSTADFAKHDVTLLVLSQIRANLNQRFPGSKGWVRSGGKALDFYCSQIIFLRQVATISREQTISGTKIKRPVGITVRANAEKNKIGMPYRHCEFELVFGYGIDDYKAMVAFLDDYKGLGAVGDMKPLALLKALRDPAGKELREKVRAAVTKLWYSIETSFLPAQGKYD